MVVDQQKLEQHLWGAANILRVDIGSHEYKKYIFGLLFFKRLSDVWQEEYKEIKDRYDGNEELAELPDEHRFDIPKEHRWDVVCKHSTNIGEHLNVAFHAIEDNESRLKGIFQAVNFNDKERFSDALLERLIQHFEKYNLCNSYVNVMMSEGLLNWKNQPLLSDFGTLKLESSDYFKFF